jgi:transcriptional regulator with PAS, ATPase and Fis domain
MSGNVRQLENEIKRLVAFLPAGQEITCQHLSPRIKKQAMNNLIATLPLSTLPEVA